MKDLLEYKLTSLIFGLLNVSDITFVGHEVPTVINEASSNSFWLYFFNCYFLMFFERFNKPSQYNFNITTK